MAKTHGKLKYDYITDSCTHGHDYLYKRKCSQSLGNIYSGMPNLIMHPSVANLKKINLIKDIFILFFSSLLSNFQIQITENLKTKTLALEDLDLALIILAW